MKHRNLLVVVSFFFLVRLILVLTIPITYDEAYYWTWSKALDLSYYDHPPITAYLIKLSSSLFGVNLLGIRFFILIVEVLNTIFMYLLCRTVLNHFHPENKKQNNNSSILAVIALHSTLIFFIGSTLVTPDAMFSVCWLGALFCIYSALYHEKKTAWYAFGFFLGLGFLSKYMMALFAPCLLLLLIFSRQMRKSLTKPAPWISVLLALAMMVPVFLWNYHNDWVSFKFQLNHGTHGSNISSTFFMEFILGQTLLVGPFLFLVMFCSMLYIFLLSILQRSSGLFFVLVFTAFPFLFFTYHSFYNRIEANWPFISYFPALVSIPLLFRLGKMKTYISIIKTGYIFSILFSLLLSLIVLIHVYKPYLPIKTATDRTRELRGWDNFPDFLKKSDFSNIHDSPLLVVSNSYQKTSITSYYLENILKLSTFPLFARDKGRTNAFSYGKFHEQGKQYLENGSPVLFVLDENESVNSYSFTHAYSKQMNCIPIGSYKRVTGKKHVNYMYTYCVLH